MKEYYIDRDGKKLGPFSLGDLRGQDISRDTLIWRADTGTAVPAHQLAELKPIFEKEQATEPGTIPHHASATNDSGRKAEIPAGTSKGKLIAIVIILALVIGAAIYFIIGKGSADREKDDVTAIHEREVQKAIQELNAEKIAKKTVEQRKELLRERKAELSSLNAQLGQTMTRKARELAELDKIKGPHLFRSRAKKEAQLSEQLQVIDRLDGKAADLRSRILSAQAAVDTLSVGLDP